MKSFISKVVSSKKNIIVFIVLVFMFQACAENSNPIKFGGSDNKNDKDSLIMGNGSTTPYIKGTYVDFWKKNNWTVSNWDALIKEMKEIGIKTLIVHFTAYNQNIWCDSQNDYATQKAPNALPNLLKAAEDNGIGVFVGLYFNEDYWDSAASVNILNTHVQRSKNLAYDIINKYGNYKSFAGWYISEEPAPYYYNNKEKFDILKNNLVNPIADYCKSLSDKPVAISTFFNQSVSSSGHFTIFMQRLGTCNVDIIILQDGIGVGHCTIDKLEEYVIAGNTGLYTNGNFKGAFWADLETFNGKLPESFDILKRKLEIVDDYVTRIVTFQYYEDMSPNGPNSFNAKKLRNDYLKYYKSKK